MDESSAQQTDSLSTTISDESDSIRIYDLNKQETKILRHDIIKRSRNPVGELNSSPDRSANVASKPLDPSIQHFSREIYEQSKSPVSPRKLKSVHLNRSPRKFNMADMQLSSEDAQGEQPLSLRSSNSVVTTSEWHCQTLETSVKTIESKTAEVSHATESLIESERSHTETTRQSISNGHSEEPTSEIILLQKEILNGNELLSPGEFTHAVDGSSKHEFETIGSEIETVEVSKTASSNVEAVLEVVPSTVEAKLEATPAENKSQESIEVELEAVPAAPVEKSQFETVEAKIETVPTPQKKERPIEVVIVSGNSKNIF